MPPLYRQLSHNMPWTTRYQPNFCRGTSYSLSTSSNRPKRPLLHRIAILVQIFSYQVKIWSSGSSQIHKCKCRNTQIQIVTNTNWARPNLHLLRSATSCVAPDHSVTSVAVVTTVVKLWLQGRDVPLINIRSHLTKSYSTEPPAKLDHITAWEKPQKALPYCV